MLLEENDYRQLVEYLTGVFGKLYGRLDERVGRWALKVEPLDPQTYPKGNTRQYYRWELPENPPSKLAYLSGLYASEEECHSAKQRLLAQIVFMEDASAGAGLFDDLSSLRKRLLAYDDTLDRGIVCPITGQPVTIRDIQIALAETSRIGRAEINIDFAGASAGGNRLDPKNLRWVKPPYYLYALRQATLDATGLKALLSKVQTKAYLTDRRQTGEAASNRDRRWEVSPTDPQFALKQDCIRIEAKLLAQVFELSGAPPIAIDDQMLAQIQAVTHSSLKSGNFRCPISGQVIRYDKFVQEVTQRVHGESPYQVAHLTPLASAGGDGKHEADNISWITELGNRVQGEDSMDKIVKAIYMMADYHREREHLTWQQVEAIAKQANDIRQSG